MAWVMDRQKIVNYCQELLTALVKFYSKILSWSPEKGSKDTLDPPFFQRGVFDPLTPPPVFARLPRVPRGNIYETNFEFFLSIFFS